jgi:hypothetical protein
VVVGMVVVIDNKTVTSPLAGASVSGRLTDYTEIVATILYMEDCLYEQVWA